MDIISPQNPRVKEWAQLLEKKHRDKQHKYIIEGIHLVQEALTAGADLECVAFDLEQGIPSELAHLAGGESAEWIGVSPAVIAKCTDTKTPQPVFAVVQKPRSAAGLDALMSREGSLVIVLDGVQDPGNVGTIIRSADAAGADGVILGRGSADLYNPKTIRSTMGSLFHLPVVEGDLMEILPEAKRSGARVISTSLQAQDTCYSYDFRQGSCWLLVGNEAKGVSEQAQQLVDDALIIPMRGQAESLNVAMASTLMLFEAMRQRHFD
ncbi:TrmH family RNA methyltransferase [Paenibacillus cellulositrophicus]|uniref:TrmH family RNA methyltransferase n=1 Tax=Paenibacillus cellulositrophicus TaxID=562959 RepID=UPI00203AAA31|nr:RNA methyltransferase [Paenibacillus cellulositrophicus]MCM2995879.1 RNA methyltransferase [Paenibacillus cellulositrophicus]